MKLIASTYTYGRKLCKEHFPGFNFARRSVVETLILEQCWIFITVLVSIASPHWSIENKSARSEILYVFTILSAININLTSLTFLHFNLVCICVFVFWIIYDCITNISVFILCFAFLEITNARFVCFSNQAP